MTRDEQRTHRTWGIVLFAAIVLIILAGLLSGCGDGQMRVVQTYQDGDARATDGIDEWTVRVQGDVKVGDRIECIDKKAGCYQWQRVEK